MAPLDGIAGALSGGSRTPGVVKGDAYTRRRLNTTEVATPARVARCDGSPPSPLHLAIIRNGFPIMFPPAAT